MKVLICTPSQPLIQPLVNILTQMGIWSEVCTSFERILTLYRSDHYNAVILWHTENPDILLENFSRWKQNSTGGQFIVLTSRQSGVERAKAWEAGINHYLIAPFSYTKLIGEMMVEEFKVPYQASARYATNHFELYPMTRTAHCENKLLNLTRKEFDLLSYLLRHRGQTLSRLQISEEIWGDQEDSFLTNTIDVHIARLRRKLPQEARYLIRTVYGIGYRMHAEA